MDLGRRTEVATAGSSADEAGVAEDVPEEAKAAFKDPMRAPSPGFFVVFMRVSFRALALEA
jgi:hypothetical protein